MGVTTTGRFAALTNYRDPLARKSSAPSRGLLVSGFLTGSASPHDYLVTLSSQRERYEGFNLVAGDGNAIYYLGNHGPRPQELHPGIYGVSNHLMDTPWPKVTLAKQRLAALLQQPHIVPEALFAMLADRSIPADRELPDTGVGIERERELGSIFIASSAYGTRASTVLLLHSNACVQFEERRFAVLGEPEGDTKLSFSIGAD